MPVCLGDSLSEVTLYQLKTIVYNSSLAIIVLFEDMTSWRASEASETLSGVYKFELVRCVYICIGYRPVSRSIVDI